MKIWFLNAIGLARNMMTALIFLMFDIPMMATVVHLIHCRCLNNCKFFSISKYFIQFIWLVIHVVLMELNFKLDKKIFMMTLVKIGWIWSIKSWHRPIILKILTQTPFVNGIWQQGKDITFPWILSISL